MLRSHQEHVEPVDRLLEDLLPPPRAAPDLRLVEANPLERRAVPGLDVRRARPLLQVMRKALIVDPESGPPQSPQVGPGLPADEPRVGREAGRMRGVDPAGPEAGLPPLECLVDGSRAVRERLAHVALDTMVSLLIGSRVKTRSYQASSVLRRVSRCRT